MLSTSKVIIVTGATGGIGRAVCAKLASSGYSLILAARNPDRLQELVSSLPRAAGADHSWISVDMAADASVQTFAEKLSLKSVNISGLVLMPPQIPPTNDCLPSSDTWRTIFQQSFVGPLAVLKSAVDSMKPDPDAGNRAKIVIISGISSAQVLGHYATSNVLRCAWLAEAKTLAFALGERGIHVNTLSLGGTLTPGYLSSLATRAEKSGRTVEDQLADETSNVPLKKYGKPEEVAQAVDGLLSPFSDHMTGLNILHDGGFTRAY